MKRALLLGAMAMFHFALFAQTEEEVSGEKKAVILNENTERGLLPIIKAREDKQPTLLKGAPNAHKAAAEQDSLAEEEFKMTYQAGAAIHMFAALSQGETTAAQEDYFFNGFNTNLRASYTSVIYGRPNLGGGAEKANIISFGYSCSCLSSTPGNCRVHVD